MESSDYLNKIAIVKTAQSRNSIKAVGEVIAYSDAPMVCVRREDGSTFWWRADLCDFKEKHVIKEKIANQTWNNFAFPEWVPEDVREQIKSFWSEDFGRGPAAWIENAEHNKSPWMGDRVRVRRVNANGDWVTGRIVFAWNNIGRLIADDGNVYVVAIHDFEVSRDGLWCKPKSEDYFTVAGNASGQHAFGHWYGAEA